MSMLQKTLEKHAQDFAAAIVQALRSASIDDLTGISGVLGPKGGARTVVTKGSSGRLNRRSADAIASALDRIVDVIRQHPEGLRAEQIKEALGLDKRELPKPIAEGLRSGALEKSGQKRATVYTLATGAGSRSKGASKSRAGAKKRTAKK